MSDKELLKEFEKYLKREGREKALSALTGRGVCASTAERLANGVYAVKKPQHKTKRALLEILGLDKAS